MDHNDITELAEWLRKRTVAVPIDEDGDNLDDVWYSYALKHRVEELRGGYVSNAEIIAAAEAAGLPVVRESTLSPNAYIGIKREGLFGYEVAA